MWWMENNFYSIMNMFTISFPECALREIHIKKVKSTYYHVYGLLVHSGSQKRSNEEKKIFAIIQGGRRLKN